VLCIIEQKEYRNFMKKAHNRRDVFAVGEVTQVFLACKNKKNDIQAQGFLQKPDFTRFRR
jgi:hypothetical protein